MWPAQTTKNVSASNAHATFDRTWSPSTPRRMFNNLDAALHRPRAWDRVQRAGAGGKSRTIWKRYPSGQTEGNERSGLTRPKSPRKVVKKLRMENYDGDVQCQAGVPSLWDGRRNELRHKERADEPSTGLWNGLNHRRNTGSVLVQTDVLLQDHNHEPFIASKATSNSPPTASSALSGSAVDSPRNESDSTNSEHLVQETDSEEMILVGDHNNAGGHNDDAPRTSDFTTVADVLDMEVESNGARLPRSDLGGEATFAIETSSPNLCPTTTPTKLLRSTLHDLESNDGTAGQNVDDFPATEDPHLLPGAEDVDNSVQVEDVTVSPPTVAADEFRKNAENRAGLVPEKLASEEITTEGMAPEGTASEETIAEEISVREMAVEENSAGEVAADGMAPEEMATEEMAPGMTAVEQMEVEEVTPQEIAVREITIQEITSQEISAQETVPELSIATDAAATIDHENLGVPATPILKSQRQEDKHMLLEFLRRANEDKAARIADISHASHRRDSGAIKLALASPRKALEDLDTNSPSPYKTTHEIDLPILKSSPTPQPSHNVMETVEEESKERAANVRSSLRRSGRARAPPPVVEKPPPNPVNIVNIHSVEDLDLLNVKRTEAHALATTTRMNTRKNKGAMSVRLLLVKMGNAPSLEPTEESPTESKPQKEKRSIRWRQDEELVHYFEEKEGTATNPEVSDIGIEQVSMIDKPVRRTLPRPTRKPAEVRDQKAADGIATPSTNDQVITAVAPLTEEKPQREAATPRHARFRRRLPMPAKAKPAIPAVPAAVIEVASNSSGTVAASSEQSKSILADTACADTDVAQKTGTADSSGTTKMRAHLRTPASAITANTTRILQAKSNKPAIPAPVSRSLVPRSRLRGT